LFRLRHEKNKREFLDLINILMQEVYEESWQTILETQAPVLYVSKEYGLSGVSYLDNMVDNEEDWLQEEADDREMLEDITSEYLENRQSWDAKVARIL
jgi:hypothetical protein